MMIMGMAPILPESWLEAANPATASLKGLPLAATM